MRAAREIRRAFASLPIFQPDWLNPKNVDEVRRLRARILKNED